MSADLERHIEHEKAALGQLEAELAVRNRALRAELERAGARASAAETALARQQAELARDEALATELEAALARAALTRWRALFVRAVEPTLLASGVWACFFAWANARSYTSGELRWAQGVGLLVGLLAAGAWRVLGR